MVCVSWAQFKSTGETNELWTNDSCWIQFLFSNKTISTVYTKHGWQVWEVCRVSQVCTTKLGASCSLKIFFNHATGDYQDLVHPIGGKISCHPHKKAIHFIEHCGDYCFFCIHFTNVRYNLIQLELPHNVWLSDSNLLICHHQHQSYQGPVLITITTLWENSLPAKSNGIHLYSHIACQTIPAGVEGDSFLNTYGSGCIISASSRIDWKSTDERYLSPKLGKTTCTHN